MDSTLENYRQLKKPSSLQEMAYQEIKRMILNGHFQPGEWIPENMLCSLLGCSRTPIREALTALQRERLVEVIPRKGGVVAPITIPDVKDIFQLRELLDCLAIRLAFDHLPEDELHRYKTIFSELLENPVDGNIEELNELDRAFHDFILRHTGNRWLYDIESQLLDNSQLIRVISTKYPGRMQAIWSEHLNIIDAIRLRDMESAEKHALIHVDNAREAVLKSIRGE